MIPPPRMTLAAIHLPSMPEVPKTSKVAANAPREMIPKTILPRTSNLWQ